MEPALRVWAPGRVLILVFVAWHTLTAVGSLGNGTWVGKLIRPLTRPYERFLGVYQSWPMFAPNAPTSTYWLEMVERDAKGEVLARTPVYAGEITRSGVELVYNRAHKLERTLSKDNRKSGRRALLERACRGTDAASVQLVEWRRKTPPRDQVGTLVVPVSEELEERRCR